MELSNDARVAFICAMPMELTPLVEKLSLTETKVGDVTVHSGTLHGREVVAIVTGMGVDFATTGTAGAPRRDAHRSRYRRGDHRRGRERDSDRHARSCPRLVVHSVTGAEYRPTPLGDGTPQGKMLTTVGLTTNPDRMAELRAQGVVSLDMETAAIAHLCDERGDPVVGVPRHQRPPRLEHHRRGVPDEQPGHDAEPGGDRRLLREASRRLEGMARLAEDATLAAGLAADAAIRACSPS